MANVTYVKSYLWQTYHGKCNYGKCIYGKSIIANVTEPPTSSFCDTAPEQSRKRVPCKFQFDDGTTNLGYRH